MSTSSPTAAAAPVALVLSAIVDFVNLGGYLTGAPIPAGIAGIDIALGVGALVAAGGLWGRQRWAVPLALALAVITVLLGITGFLASGSMTGKVVGAVGVLVGLAVLALVVPRATRRVVV